MERIRAFKFFGKQYYYKSKRTYEVWQAIGTASLAVVGIIYTYLFAILMSINK